MSAHAPSGANAATGVEQLVRAAARSLRAVHLLESALCAAAAALLVLAAGVQSGARLAELGSSGIAALVALAAGCGWFLERKRGDARVARELDLALGEGGALATAYEHARSAQPVVRALEARVLSRVDAPRARRALLPSPLLVAPAPFAAGALLALALEQRALELRPVQTARLHVQLASALDEARGEALALGSARASALVELAQRAHALSEDAGAAVTPLELARIEAALSGALANERPPAALERALEQARNAAQAALERERGAAAARGSAAAEAATARGSAAAELTAATSVDSSDASSSAPPRTASSASASSQARWWPATYDGIVAAWVEARRASAASTTPVQRAPTDTKDSPP